MNTAFWYASRATGIVALLLLTAVHRNLSLLSVAFIVVHVLTAVLDTYVHIPLISAVIPFASGYERLWLALGAISLDIMLAMIVTSLLRGRLNRILWRAVHLLAYASWPVAFAHSIGSSKDLQQGWMLGLAVACAVIVSAAVFFQAEDAIRDRNVTGVQTCALPISRPEEDLCERQRHEPHAEDVRQLPRCR